MNRPPPWMLAAGAIIVLRFVSLTWSGFSQEYGYLEAHYALLANSLEADLVPRRFGDPIYNTPPLYVWLLSAWGHVAGWTDWVLRVPSAAAWALTTVPIYRLARALRDERAATVAVFAWLTFPLSFIVGGKVMPDALLACLTAWAAWSAWQRRLTPFLVLLVTGVLVKPVAAVTCLIPLVQGWRRGVIAAGATGALVAAMFLGTGFGPFILHHFTHRGTGSWDLGFFLEEALLVGGVLAFLSLQRPLRADLALWACVAGILAFTLYAMPPYEPHQYYWLPALPLLAVLVGVGTWNLRPRLVRGLVAGAFLLALVQSMDNGDFWDHRLRDMTREAPAADAVEPGMSYVTAWYTRTDPPPAMTQPPTGTVWTYRPLAGCVVLEAHPAEWRSDGPLWVYDCGPGPATSAA